MRRFYPFVFLFILAVIYFLPMFLNPDKIIHGFDLFLDYSWKSFIKNEMLSGRFPIWNPFDRTGFPSFANPSYGIWYPSNLLFLSMPVSFAYNLSIFLHVLMASFFSYLFARSLKMGVLASLTVAVIFTMNGYLPARIYSGHRVIIEPMAWIPVIFYLFQGYIETGKRKHLIFCSAAIGLQLLAGYPAVSVYTFEALGLYGIFAPFNNIKFRIKAFLIAVFVGFLLSAVQMIPFFELAGHLTRTNFSYAKTVIGSFLPPYFLTFIYPLFSLNPLTSVFNGNFNYWDIGVYPGLLSLLLFPLSLFFLKIRKNQKSSIAFWVICIFMMFMALGSANPFYKYIWKLVPFYQSTRIPARHLIAFIFSFAVLAGFGMQLVKNRFVQGVILALLIIDLYVYSQRFITMESPKIYEGNEKIISFLKADNNLFRIYQTYSIDSIMRVSVLDFDTPFIYGISTIKAYDPYALKTYHDYINKIEGKTEYGDFDVPLSNITSDELNFLNAKYFLIAPDASLERVDSGRYRRVITDSLYSLYENMKVLPRFFLEKDTDGKVDVSSYNSSEVVLKVNAKNDTKLMSSELYYPGWKMEIDGKKTDFTMIKDIFRGARITKGDHVVRWYFLPSSLILGGTVSFVTFVFCVYLLVFPRSEKRKPVKD